MKSILVIRLSSLGDVILTIPVFKTLELHLPEQEFIFVSQESFKDLFEQCTNVTFFGADVSGKNDGPAGLLRLFRQLQHLEFDEIIDLHNVFRSNMLTTSFKLKGKVVHVYDKLRSAKNDRIAGRVPMDDIPHTSEQYLMAFSYLKKGLELTPGPWINFDTPETAGRHIGLAPFSSHTSKEWPHDYMLDLIRLLNERDYTIHCLGFGEREREIISSWQRETGAVNIIDERFTLKEQMELIASLDTMVSMDSANMHLACIIGIPVVSIWGPTHPSLGFGPLNNHAGILQPTGEFAVDRPLSRYGHLKTKKEAEQTRLAFATITPHIVMEKIGEVLR